MYASLLIFGVNIPTLYFWVFLSNCLAYRPILRKDVNQRKPCPPHDKNTAKGANLLHPLDVQKAKKASGSPLTPTGGSAPWTPA